MTIIDTIQHYRNLLDALLTGQPNPRAIADRPLTDQLALFEEIAQGKLERGQATPAFVAEVEEAVDQLLLILCTPPDIQEPTVEALPRDIWTRSESGQLLARVAWWLYQDDLITLREAASVLYGNTGNAESLRVHRDIERGDLDFYLDPYEANPQHGRRVRQSQVITLKAQQSARAPQPKPPLDKSTVDIVALHDVERKSFREIGDLIGVKRQSVHQMYHKLKAQPNKQ